MAQTCNDRYLFLTWNLWKDGLLSCINQLFFQSLQPLFSTITTLLYKSAIVSGISPGFYFWLFGLLLEYTSLYIVVNFSNYVLLNRSALLDASKGTTEFCLFTFYFRFGMSLWLYTLSSSKVGVYKLPLSPDLQPSELYRILKSAHHTVSTGSKIWQWGFLQLPPSSSFCQGMLLILRCFSFSTKDRWITAIRTLTGFTEVRPVISRWCWPVSVT